MSAKKQMVLEAAFEEVVHESYSGRRVAWLVSFLVAAPGNVTAKKQWCCGSEHGHRTQETAKKCFAKAARRVAKDAVA